MARFALIAAYLPSRMARLPKMNGHLIERGIMGNRMLLDPHDEGLSRDLILDGIREPLLTKIIRTELQEGDRVIDIGANIGYYALQESSLVGKSGHVIAIEPVSANLDLLRKNIALNRCENIGTYHLAIGAEDGMASINLSPSRNLCSLVAKDREYIGTEKVKVLTLDTFLRDKEYPTMLRMDVEGYEIEILKGMRRILSENKPLKIVMELHLDILQEKSFDVLDILQYFGFEVKWCTVEPHAAVKSGLGLALARFFERGIGAASGYLDLKLADLYKREFTSGQVEYLEVMFER